LFTVASEVNDSNIAWVTSIYLAEVSLETNEHLDFSEKALARAIELSYGQRTALLSLQAMILARKGEVALARGRLEEAYKAAREEEALTGQFLLSLAEAGIAMAVGDGEQASSHFEKAVDIAEQCGMRWYRADTLMQWADALTGSGQASDKAKARELLEEAEREFGEMGVAIYQREAEKRLAQIAA
jgi:tetratricopeptide (TPR) repeat protein